MIKGEKDKDSEIAYQCNVLLKNRIPFWNEGLYNLETIALLLNTKIPTSDKMIYFKNPENLYRLTGLMVELDLVEPDIIISEEHWIGVVAIFLTKIKAKQIGLKYDKGFSDFRANDFELVWGKQ